MVRVVEVIDRMINVMRIKVMMVWRAENVGKGRRRDVIVGGEWVRGEKGIDLESRF